MMQLRGKLNYFSITLALNSSNSELQTRSLCRKLASNIRMRNYHSSMHSDKPQHFYDRKVFAVARLRDKHATKLHVDRFSSFD